MYGPPVGGLFYLRTATEAVGNDHGVLARGPDLRQQYAFGGRHRHVVMTAFEAEVPGQATAAGVQLLAVDPGPFHQAGVGGQHRVLMAVRLHHRVHVELRWIPVLQELAERDELHRQPPDVLLVRQQLRGVRPEHRAARRLEADDRYAGPDRVPQYVGGSSQCPLGDTELTGRDPGQPAAHGTIRERDLVARGFQYLDRGPADRRVEEVRERVRPEHDPAVRFLRAPALGSLREPVGERLLREPWQLSFVRDP